MVKKHSERKHSLLGPSASERWIACPGSVELSKSAPPQKENAYSREGTQAHECLEFIVRRYGDRRGAKQDALKKWPLDMVEHALNSADIIFSDKLRPSPHAELLIEQRVHLRSVKDIYGTLDYAWVDLWGVLTVIDFKYGAGVTVFTEDEEGNPNPQLMLYAAAVASKYNYDFERVRIAIIQPRVYGPDEDPISVTDVSIKQLKAFERFVAGVVKEALTPGARFKAGEHCRWCPCVTMCPENSRKALEAAHVAFDIEEGIQAAPEPFLLTADNLPTILEACTKLEVWIKAVREHAHQLAEKGTKIPGYKLVAKKAQRTWTEAAESAAAARWKLDAYRLEKHFLSPAQLEKALGEEAKKFTKQYTVAISSGTHLVPSSDKRSELISASPVFDTDVDIDEDDFEF